MALIDFFQGNLMNQAQENKIQLTEEQKIAIAEVIRNDLNLEKSPVFILAKSKGEMKVREIEWQRRISKDETILSKIRISPSLDHGNLNTEDQKVLYALIKLWEEKGRPEVLVFSLNQLAKALNKTWSVYTYNSLKDSLLRLRFTAFVWIKAYYDEVTNDYYDELDSFTILSDLKIAKRGNNERITVQACKIKFNEHLDKNLRSKYTQPAFYNQIIKFRSGLAQLIYQLAELVMHDKIRYERNSEGLLLEDLKLDCIEYKYPSGRKKVLDVAVKELQGVPIPSGIITASVEWNKDKSDYKLVLVKEVQMLLDLKFEEDAKQPESSQGAKPATKTTSKTEEPAQATSQPVSLAEQIVRFFLEKFRVKRKTPLKKELLTAQDWIDEYNLDLEKAQVFISKCKVWAAETDFDVQNFAGLQQYLDRTTQIFEQMEVERAIKACNLCDNTGHIDGKEESGREFVFKCVHNREVLQAQANKHKFQIILKDKTILDPK
jgi:hypothetical protein